MAKVIGESGRSAGKLAIRHFQIMFLMSLFGVGLVSLITGYLFCLTFQIGMLPVAFAFGSAGLLTVVAFWIYHWVSRDISRHELQRMHWRKGALGEATIGYLLEGLPNDYIVFNDLAMLDGKIDHVVIGPTGIFVIDTKNWRGSVVPDGNGELLCNHRSSGRNEVKRLLRIVASLREKINILTRREDFIQGMLAFPLARVEAPWGATRNVHCVTDDRILDYIENYRFSRRIKKEEIELIEKGILAIAGMGSRFDPAEGGLTILPMSK